jgi:hypothetical protein
MSDERHAPYARETAMCVEFAYNSFEEDLRAELTRATGETHLVLLRLVKKITERRAVLDRFIKGTSKAA